MAVEGQAQSVEPSGPPQQAAAQKPSPRVYAVLFLASLSVTLALTGFGLLFAWVFAGTAILLGVRGTRPGQPLRALSITAVVVSALTAVISLAVTIYFIVDFRPGPHTPNPGPSSPIVVMDLPAGVTAEYRDGRYTVGEDMEPGTYRTVVTLTLYNSDYCSWTVRAAGAEDANDVRGHALSEGIATVTVTAGDEFESSGCFGWNAVDPAAFLNAGTATTEPDPNVFVPPGMWLVGPDLAPGLYRSPVSVITHSLNPYCSLELYADWSGLPQAVIATWALTGGYPVFEVELGQQINTRGCGHFEKVTLEGLVAESRPESTMQDGIWLVGVDIRPGEYRETPLPGADPDFCLVEVYHSAALDRDAAQGLFDLSPEMIEVSVGEVVVARDCGQWDLVR